MGRGIGIALLISVGLNIFVLGILGGQIISARNNNPQPDPGVEMRPMGGPMGASMGVFRHVRDLPAEERAAFKEALAPHRGAFRADRRETMQLRMAFVEALSADEWDRAAVERVARALHSREAERGGALTMALIDAFETLPAERRKMLVEKSRQEHAGRRMDRRQGYRRPRRGPPPMDDVEEGGAAASSDEVGDPAP